MCIQNLQTLAQIEAEKSVTENFVREKEKWTNKGTDKQYVADSLLHSTTVALIDSELIRWKKNWKERKKRTNKGTYKPYVADSLYTVQVNLSYLMFVPYFKILGQVVPEKSLTKISIFITLE